MKEKINSILPALRAGLRAGLFLLKLTTLFVLALIGWKIFGGKIPHFAAYSLAFVFAALGAFVVDGVLDKVLPFAMSRATTDDKNERTFKRAITVLSVILLLISGTLSWWAMPELSEVAIGGEAPKTDSTLAEIQEFRSGFLAEVQDKDRELSEARETESRRIWFAKQEGRKLVSAAIAAGPVKWQELYRSKNGWFLKQGGQIRKYRQSIAAAEAKAAELVEKERALASSIREEKAGIEKSRGAAIDSISTAFTGIAVAQANRHESRLRNMTNVLLICDVAWMLLSLFLSWLIGLVDGHEFRAENRNIFGVLFEVADDREQGVLAGIEWRLKRKNPTKRTTQSPTKPTETDPTERGPAPDVIPASFPTERGLVNGRELAVLQARQDGLDWKLERILSMIPTERNPTEHRPKDATPSENEPTQRRRKSRRKVERKSADGTRPCRNCGEGFVGKTKRAVYCSDACRKSWHEKKN